MTEASAREPMHVTLCKRTWDLLDGALSTNSSTSLNTNPIPESWMFLLKRDVHGFPCTSCTPAFDLQNSQ